MNIATIAAGQVEYGVEDAAIDIADLIAQLTQAQADGATHVVGLSGNYRGASYVRLGEVAVQLDTDPCADCYADRAAHRTVSFPGDCREFVEN